MKKTLYLLTGATGYLGSHITRALIAQNKTVRALVLKDDPAISLVPPEAEIVFGDIVNPCSMEAFFNVPGNMPGGIELIVIHCAGMTTLSPELSEKLYAINVMGTKNIIRACIRHNVKKLVYISSTDAIPELPHGEVMREVDSFLPGLVVGGYGQTKAEATQLVLDPVRENDLDASIVFPSGITGPNDHGNGYFTKFFIDYVNGKIPAGISGSFNTVDVRDLAEGVVSCSEKGRKGEGYIMSNRAVSIRELFRLISNNTGASRVRIILPVFTAALLAAFSSFFSFFTKKPGLFNSYAVYNITRNNVFSSEKARKELGFKARPFKITIRDLALWLHTRGRICIDGEATENLDNLIYMFNLSPATIAF